MTGGQDTSDVTDDTARSSGRYGRNAVVGGVVALTIALIFVAPICSEWSLPVFPQDEGILLVYPSMLLHGAVANRTFSSVYGVSNLWLIAAAFKVFGSSVAVERAVGITYRLGLVVSLGVLAWRHRGPVAAIVAAASCVVFLVGTLGLAAYAYIAALCCSSLGILLLDLGQRTRPSRALVALSGVSFGVAVGCRLDILVGIALVVLVLGLLWRKNLWWLVMGAVVGLVPVWINLAQAGPSAVFRGEFIDPVIVSGPSRRLPLSTLSWQELTLLAVCVGVALASACSGLVRVRLGGRSWGAVLLLVLGAFELGLLPEAFQRSDQLHLALVCSFTIPAAVLLPPRQLGGLRSWAGMNAVPVVVAAAVLALAAPYFGRLYRSEALPLTGTPTVNVVTNDGRSVPVSSSQDQRDLIALLDELDGLSKTGQRVFVGPRDLRTANYNDTFIYFLLPRLTPSGFYLEMNPGEANGAHSGLADDVARADFLILSDRYDNFPDPDTATRLGPSAPNRVVRADFRVIATRGPWTLFERTTD